MRGSGAHLISQSKSKRLPETEHCLAAVGGALEGWR